jgi:hypothetical protein
MASNVLAAIRRCPQLKGNKKFTSLEVAHLMNKSGYGRAGPPRKETHVYRCWREVLGEGSGRENRF